MAVFVIPYTTPPNYTYNSAEIEVAGGYAILKENFADLYARWHLNQSIGTNVPDSTDNGRDGTTSGMTDSNWVPGKLNNCLYFSGEDQYVYFGDIAGWERDVPFSLDFWFYGETVPNPRDILGKWDDTKGYRAYLSAAGRIGFVMASSTGGLIDIATSVSGLQDAWHHVVITYDGTSQASGFHIWIDNTDDPFLIASDTLTSGTIVNAADFQMGDVGSPFPDLIGNLDEVLIWTKVLTSGDVAKRWDSGVGSENVDYLTTSPTIYKTTGNTDPEVLSWTNFVETTGPGHNGTIAYQLSDNGTTWYYWNGSVWAVDGAGNYNDASTVNANISSFTASAQTIFVKAFFISSGTQAVVLDENQVGYLTNVPPYVDAGTNKVTYDHTTIQPFSDCDFYDNDGVVEHAYYKVDGEVDVWTEIPQGSYPTLLEAVRAFSYEFNTPGEITVRLQVEDDEEAKSDDSLIVTVLKYTVTFDVVDIDSGAHISAITFVPGDGSGPVVKSSPFTWDYDWFPGTRYADFTKTGYIGKFQVPVATTVHTESLTMIQAILYEGHIGANWDRVNSKLVVDSWLTQQARIVSGVTSIEISVEVFDPGGSISVLDSKVTSTFNSRDAVEIEFTSTELGGVLDDDGLYVIVGKAIYNGADYYYMFPFTTGGIVRRSDIHTWTEKLDKIFTGRWKIVNNQMIFYDSDGLTPLLTFDLKDQLGDPTVIAAFERLPVP